MPVRTVFLFQVHRGRQNEWLEGLRTVKKVVDRVGGTLSAAVQMVGPTPGHCVVVGQYTDWATLAKVRMDPAYTAFVAQASANPNPPAELTSVAIYEDIAL
jgi:quinol monooxygenase YgiN